MKEHLKENCSVLVFKSDNENFVDFVNTKFPLDYSYYGYSFNDMLDIGCLAKYPDFIVLMNMLIMKKRLFLID